MTHNLTDKLLTYATGRLMEPTDRGEVDRIVKQLHDTSGGLRDLFTSWRNARCFSPSKPPCCGPSRNARA